ncbi:MAG: CHASE2 domain-containing protein [Ignavibacteriae bacterium]|nr:MAG: CHASE2 domain-containing protein [Chlorobiota bacterium]MBL1122342.1 CHASE2 domain-containing protein [Ignavibacteriota bacterium]MCE7854976.1 CHASE2 domain-containing protein [Ignavibacteria bacterium CHB3]
MSHIKYKNYVLIRITILILVSLVLFLVPDFRKSIDNEIENLFIKTRGQIEPDTNIIIIHFSENDIARIGPWPIKRNYYALLINQLTHLGVKKIGLEVFLSSRLVTQSVYDNLLMKEIEKSGKVILSCIAGSIVEKNNLFVTDSLSYPSPKLLNEKLLTGHINYLKEDRYEIPLNIRQNEVYEKAFSLQLSGKQLDQKSVIVNFVSSWNSFKKYSALDFAELVYSQSNELKLFKNKIIIIGISDPQIASAIQTPFDEQMPGVALHAFALDNILNSRDVDNRFYVLSATTLLLIILGLIIYRSIYNNKNITIYLFAVISVIIGSFVLINFYYWKISLSFFFIPLLAIIITDISLYFIQGKEELKGALDESTALRNLLHSKENQLNTLQREIKESGKESSQLIEKINSLQSDIKKLKGSEDDRSQAGIIVSGKVENFYGIIYSSTLMKRVVDLIQKAAPTDATILITGDSGTGKELVAKAVHSLSKRKDKNFISVNCAALNDSLLESELFGYEKGAFTGAVTDKQGRFELADGGTIFLDEIGETSENFQSKLLRVLQSGEIEKVGSTKPNSVDVRVVAATNKNLSALVKEKLFREDLYYRLNVINIEVPPLKDRKEDINLLAKSFIEAENSSLQISVSALQALNDYNWKGNVRELESVVMRAIIFTKSDGRNLIQLADLPKEIVKETTFGFDDIVLESLRSKKFSHSAIVETARELGNVNRTLISENLRGLAFKILVECNFNIDKAILTISESGDKETNDRVRDKLQTFIKNIENDILKSGVNNFEAVKKKFASKYKNLPVKFHLYLDKVIQNKIERLL